MTPRKKQQKDSSWFHYVCEHGASNEPCFACRPDLFEFNARSKTWVPKKDAVKDESWVADVPDAGGITDGTNLTNDARG